ncbi:MAG: hypothetical protein KL787_08870 [Taibaiella sp.]|nr:hypothetical protein [Taibaiella sp.]
MKLLRLISKLFRSTGAKGETQSENEFSLPEIIAPNENIARFVFSPIHINKDKKRIKPNIFKPPYGSDEVSVNRFDFTNCNFLKQLALKMQNPNKEFFGLAILKANAIRLNNFEVLYSKIENNLYHSDIKIGLIHQREVELPAEISLAFKNLVNESKLFIDSNVDTPNWIGDPVLVDKE